MFGSDSQLQDLARGTLVGPYGDLLQRYITYINQNGNKNDDEPPVSATRFTFEPFFR